MPDQAGGDLLPPWSGWQGTWILLQSFPVPKRGTSASTLTLPHSVTNTHCPGVHMPSNNRAWTQGGSYHTQKCLLRSIQPNISHLHFTPKTMTFFIKKILKREAPPHTHTPHTLRAAGYGSKTAKMVASCFFRDVCFGVWLQTGVLVGEGAACS